MPSSAKSRLIKPAGEGQPPKAPTTRKRQPSARISAACEACKKRKTKCTGGPPPCQLCQSLGTECVIDLTLDMRRRAALQRTVDESKSFQDTLNKLIDCIRDESSPRFETLVEYVRGGASNQDVIDAVQHSQGVLEDDSDNTSILHNGIHESQSPPNEPVDDSSGPQIQISGEIFFDGKKRHMTEQIMGILPSHESEPIADTSALLSKLKILPTADGERLLHRLLATNSGSAQYDEGYTAAQHALDDFSRSAVAPSSAERSTWHPALQVHSESAWTQEQRQHGENGPFQRRYSEVAPVVGTPEQLSSTNSSNQRSPASRAEPPPALNTSRPWPPSLQSPISPYVEFTGVSPLKYPVGYAWDLSVAQEAQMTRLRIPVHLVLPLIIPDDSLLSNMYSNYVEGARHLLGTGRPLSEIVGTGDWFSVELFFRPRTETDGFDCASWACEVCRALAVLDDSVRIATAYLLTCMMRWLLAPTQENYAKLPDIMKPTPSQRMIPHIGAIEMLPLGPLRDALIYHMRDWLSFVSKDTWSINWPFDENAAIEQDPVTNTRRLTPKFIEHIRNYENWSVSRQFLQAFPELMGRIRVHD